MAKLPTVNDVAAAAGVSRQTVSNAINRPEVVRPDTLQRVRQAIQALDYRPHASARRLRTQRASTIAVRIDRISDGISGSVLDTFLHALTQQAEGCGLRVLLYTARDPDDEIRAIDRLIAGSDVDAFVLTSTFRTDPRPAWLIAHGQSFVTFGRPWDVCADDPHYRWVDVDARLGVRLATQRLMADAGARVGFLGWPSGSGTGDERRLGWREAMTAGGASQTDLARLDQACQDDLNAGRAAARELLDRAGTLDGVVAASDTLGLAALAELGEATPVIGFDNTPIAATIGLSSIDQRIDLVAHHVLGLLTTPCADDQAGDSSPTQTHYLVAPALVMRQPSAALRLPGSQMRADTAR